MIPLLLFLSADLDTITKGFDGRIGACIQYEKALDCTRGDERFSMQSVVKLIVGVAILDDERYRVNQPVTIFKKDLSLGVQPIAKLVGPDGYKTTIGDLIRRTIIDSDSAACDILIAKLGGPQGVQSFLNRKKIAGIRVDRDERHLQTETSGLKWRDAFVDPATLERATRAVSEKDNLAAYKRYQTDPRDTATPKGMANFLMRLAQDQLLPPGETAFILKALEDCATFPDRLKAGVPKGWGIGHKTGTSGSRQGLTVATNDVGILTSPDGTKIAVVAFVADSRASAADRAAIMAKIAAAAIHAR